MTILTPFQGGGDVYLQYDKNAAAINSDASQRLLAATFISLSTPTSILPQYSLAGGFSTDLGNLTDNNISNSGVGIYMTNATGAFTGGSGTLINVIILGYVLAPLI